ncbi:MAG: hypothetical protein BJ554DRAFT_1577, partial [Olpidium bornovanus]
ESTRQKARLSEKQANANFPPHASRRRRRRPRPRPAHLRLVPLHRLFLADAVGRTNLGLAPAATRHAHPGPSHDDVEVHAVNANGGIVLDTEVDVLLDAEAEVAGGREVLGPQLVLLDLEPSFQDLLSLGTTDGAMDSNLLVAADAECPHGVPRLRVDGRLASELLQHLGRAGQTISRFANANIENELSPQRGRASVNVSLIKRPLYSRRRRPRRQNPYSPSQFEAPSWGSVWLGHRRPF